MTLIAGIGVKDPTAVWTQLMSTRRSVLDNEARWSNGSWLQIGDPKFGQPTTMCLANAMRFVAYGRKDHPDDYARSEMPVAEKLVLAAINRRYTPGYDSIPTFNDESGRTFEQIVQVIDDAIALVEPHARKVVLAEEVMTDEERKEINAKVRDAEDEIWKEWFADLAPFKAQTCRDWGVRGAWLSDHEKRGWKTFWDELLECDEHDEDCKRRKQLIGA